MNGVYFRVRDQAPFLVIVAVGAALAPAAARIGSRPIQLTPSDIPAPNRAAVAIPAKVPEITASNSNFSTLAGLFGEPEPAPVARAAALSTLSITPTPPVAAPDPLTGYRMTGTVTVNGRGYALLENIKTKDGIYLADGQQLEGLTVTKVNAASIEFGEAGSTRQIALNEDYSFASPSVSIESGKAEVAQLALESANSDIVLVSGTRLLTNYIDVGVNSVSGVNVEKLKDDVFEGKMSVDEFNQKVGPAVPYDIYFANKVLGDNANYYRNTVTDAGMTP